jgi:hypothetical protein
MIIVDLNQVMISNLLMQIGKHTNASLEENMVRHMVLNSLRSYNSKFRDEYGEMIIACDNKNYWRKKLFPYYKANRKKNIEKSELDWNSIFETMNKIREELKNFFPYRVINIESAEADDVIATLVSEFGSPLNTGEKILIVSGDKDFIQLHTYSNVKQYDPVRKKQIHHNDPALYLKEHIMRGDAGDGVPNFLSQDDCFVVGIRQTPITSKKLVEWVTKNPEEFCDSRMLRNYSRNKQLIDLSMIPVEIKEKVMNEYYKQSNKDKKDLFNYFVKNKLKNLIEHIGDF